VRLGLDDEGHRIVVHQRHLHGRADTAGCNRAGDGGEELEELGAALSVADNRATTRA
jgi:hypothetical protein